MSDCVCEESHPFRRFRDAYYRLWSKATGTAIGPVRIGHGRRAPAGVRRLQLKLIKFHYRLEELMEEFGLEDE